MLETLNQVDLNLSKRLERITDISDMIIANTELNDLLSPAGAQSYFNRIVDLDYRILGKYLVYLTDIFEINGVRFYIMEKLVDIARSAQSPAEPERSGNNALGAAAPVRDAAKLRAAVQRAPTPVPAVVEGFWLRVALSPSIVACLSEVFPMPVTPYAITWCTLLI